MPARQRAAGETFAGGPSEGLLAALDQDFFSLLDTAADPLDRGLRWACPLGQRAHKSKKKDEDVDNDGVDKASSHLNGSANGESVLGFVSTAGRPSGRGRGGTGAPGPRPTTPPATCLWSCAVISCFVLSVVLPTVAAILVYRKSGPGAVSRHGPGEVEPPKLRVPSPPPPPPPEGGKDKGEASGKDPWWEVLRKRRMAAQAAVDLVKGLAGRNNVAKEAEPPEFECRQSNGEPCSAADSRGGPPTYLTRSLQLSGGDLALLRSLARYKEGREAIAGRVAKPTLAFLFLTRGPMPLAPLWERFFQGQEGRYTIYVHTAPAFRFTEEDSPLFRNAQIPSELAVWGSPRMVDAERRLLAHALADPANHRFVLLSESCAPLRPFDDVWEYLFTTELSFVESVQDPSPWGQGRYSPQMKPEIQPRHWRKGSQWWSLNRRHAYMMVEDRKVWAKIQRYCRGDKWHRHCYADEHYFQTLLHILDPGGLANRSVTMADWSARSWHPKIFAANNTDREAVRYYRDMTERTAAISIVDEDLDCSLPGEDSTRLCFLFIRKMEPSALASLLDMAGDLLGY